MEFCTVHVGIWKKVKKTLEFMNKTDIARLQLQLQYAIALITKYGKVDIENEGKREENDEGIWQHMKFNLYNL